jgi:hypothetical protein
MKIHGGCLCGKTRYELSGALQGLNDCHCVDCRRSAGAPYVTWGSVRPSEMRIVQGGLRKVSHADRLRYFAECCGTPLFFKEDEASEWIDVTIGSLDDPSGYAPQQSTWTEDKLPWVKLDPALPAYPQKSPMGI